MRKALTSIIAAAALVTLVVPAAQATFDASLPTKSPHAKITKTVKVTKHKAHPQRIVETWHWRTATVIPSPVPSLYECAYSGNNCTDEQLCEFWSMNCDLVTLSSTTDSSLPAPAQSTYNDSAGT